MSKEDEGHRGCPQKRVCSPHRRNARVAPQVARGRDWRSGATGAATARRRDWRSGSGAARDQRERRHVGEEGERERERERESGRG